MILPGGANIHFNIVPPHSLFLQRLGTDAFAPPLGRYGRLQPRRHNATFVGRKSRDGHVRAAAHESIGYDASEAKGYEIKIWLKVN